MSTKKDERRVCDSQGCASLQVVRREVELYAESFKELFVEYKQCLSAAKEAIAEMKAAAHGHSQALRAGTREFNIINDELDRLRDNVHDIETRVTVLEQGGIPVGRGSAAGWGAAFGGVVSVIGWIFMNFLGG